MSFRLVRARSCARLALWRPPSVWLLARSAIHTETKIQTETKSQTKSKSQTVNPMVVFLRDLAESKTTISTNALCMRFSGEGMEVNFPARESIFGPQLSFPKRVVWNGWRFNPSINSHVHNYEIWKHRTIADKTVAERAFHVFHHSNSQYLASLSMSAIFCRAIPSLSEVENEEGHGFGLGRTLLTAYDTEHAARESGIGIRRRYLLNASSPCHFGRGEGGHFIHLAYDNLNAAPYLIDDYQLVAQDIFPRSDLVCKWHLIICRNNGKNLNRDQAHALRRQFTPLFLNPIATSVTG